MPVSMRDFWSLAAASGLYSADTCGQLQDRFAALKGAEQQTSARALAEWLISTGAISRYQASVLLSGRPGPFVFSDFTIVERIDAGRLARSFRARFKDGRPVLLVFTASDHDADADATVARFEAAQSVHSPHVARVHHFVRSTTPSFFVLEDFHGQTLAERAPAKLPSSDACRIAFQASLGLVAMHAAGVVHGQVCPRNLWIDSTSSVKLLQFPLVAPVAPNLRLQSPGVDYLAPELADPNHFPDVLSDLYGLGCTLFELIAGRVPFPGGTEADRLRRHRTEVAQRLDRLVEGVSEDLADVVAELLDKEPMLRAQTASHVAHLLSPFTSVVDQPRTARPPLDGRQLQAPGYGAWREPGWQEPPQQIPAQAAPVTAAPKPQPPEQKLIAPALPVASPAVNTIAGVRTVAKKTPGRPSSAAAATMPSNTMPARRAGTVESRADGPHASDTVAVMPEPNRPARKIETGKIEPSKIDAGDSEALVSASAGARRTKRRRADPTLIGVGAALVVAALFGVVAIVMSSGDAPATPSQSGTPNAGANLEKAPAPAEAAQEESNQGPATNTGPLDADALADARKPARATASEIDDDGQTLWVAPTAGKPLEVRYLPSAAQMIIALRPAEILASAEGPKLLDALGPGGEFVKNQLPVTLGVALADVEQLSIAFVPDEAGQPQVAYVVRLAKPIDKATLVEAWGRPATADHNSKSYYHGPRLAYYLPADAEGRLAVIAPAAVMTEILDRRDGPTLRAGIERLLRSSDSTRHFNLIAAPGFLLAAGENSLLAGELARLREPLARILGEGLQAVQASAQLGEELFLELRVLGPSDKNPEKLATELRARLATASEQLETYVAALVPQPYGRLVIHRFPRMVQLACDFTRAGVEDRQAVLRAYLPASAAHNLVLGAELTLSEPTAAVSAAPAFDSPAASTTDAGVAAALSKKISLSFPRDTLQHALELLAAEMGVDVVILGRDLQIEGITKNQSFALDERDQPAGDILRKVLALANPDGKLVYVIKPADRGTEAIFITTRAAAAKRGEPLPAELEQKTRPKRP